MAEQQQNRWNWMLTTACVMPAALMLALWLMGYSILAAVSIGVYCHFVAVVAVAGEEEVMRRCGPQQRARRGGDIDA